MTEPLAPFDDVRSAAVLDEGSGPVLLVVHPGGGDATSWDAVTGHLADGYRVVRIHRRIYAPGARVALPHSMAVEAADIVAVARRVGFPVVLVGHSSGAVAALEAALLAPSAFAALCLYEPPLPTRELVGGAAVIRARAALDAGDAVEAMRIHMRDIARFPGQWVHAMFADPHVRRALCVHAEAQIADDEAIDALGTGTDRYAHLGIPATLIEGDLSPAHLRERLADLAATLPDARVVTLAGQGHIAHLDAPAALAAVIRDAAERVHHA